MRLSRRRVRIPHLGPDFGTSWRRSTVVLRLFAPAGALGWPGTGAAVKSGQEDIMKTPRNSFDTRILSFAGIGICALIVSAFISVATPKVTAPLAGTYDGASSSEWPKS